jgi:hypothetical protein
MKVRDLIEQLGLMDQEADVHFSYCYGDHWRTQVAPRVDEVFEGLVKRSEYHSMDRLMDESDMYEEDGDYEGTRRVVVLG